MSLTTDSTSSGHGLPVLRVDGNDYGPGDIIKDGGRCRVARAIVSTWAQQPGRSRDDLNAARAFLGQGPVHSFFFAPRGG